jgi:hypothetical protein
MNISNTKHKRSWLSSDERLRLLATTRQFATLDNQEPGMT